MVDEPLITLSTLVVAFAFAILVLGVRIQGSVVGFLAVSVACALMATTFGLLIAAIGGTPAATRGVATFVVLVTAMLGGAWMPTFSYPAWLQQLTVVVPTRWAVDGLDAMTWRGLGLSVAHSIVTEHGGRIWVENRPEGGAVFNIDLPIGEPEPARESIRFESRRL